MQVFKVLSRPSHFAPYSTGPACLSVNIKGCPTSVKTLMSKRLRKCRRASAKPSRPISLLQNFSGPLTSDCVCCVSEKIAKVTFYGLSDPRSFSESTPSSPSTYVLWDTLGKRRPNLMLLLWWWGRSTGHTIVCVRFRFLHTFSSSRQSWVLPSPGVLGGSLVE